MPADSDGAGPPPLPRTWRPLGPRIAGVVAGGALLMITAFLWFGLEPDVRDSVTPFQRGTVVAMFLLGFACLYALARSRVVAREEGLHVVNGYRSRDYTWPEIVAVRAMVPRDGSQRLMDQLWDLGARGILLTDIHACRL